MLNFPGIKHMSYFVSKHMVKMFVFLDCKKAITGFVGKYWHDQVYVFK